MNNLYGPNLAHRPPGSTKHTWAKKKGCDRGETTIKLLLLLMHYVTKMASFSTCA